MKEYGCRIIVPHVLSVLELAKTFKHLSDTLMNVSDLNLADKVSNLDVVTTKKDYGIELDLRFVYE